MPEMMKYRKTGKFKLGFLTLLLSVLFVACGSLSSTKNKVDEVRNKLSTKDRKGKKKQTEKQP